MNLKIFLLLFLFLFPLVYSEQEQNYKQLYDECVILRQNLSRQNSDLKFNNILIFELMKKIYNSENRTNYLIKLYNYIIETKIFQKN
jgi:hypothetical protein